jgi:hypothetical protein
VLGEDLLALIHSAVRAAGLTRNGRPRQ